MVLTKTGLPWTGTGITFSILALSSGLVSKPYPHVVQAAENMLKVSCCATFYITEKKKKKWWWIIVHSLEKSPLKWKLFLACVSLSAESPAVKYCTAIQQRNLICLSRDLEVGQNHIYQWLNLSLHSRRRLSRMKQVFKSISAFWCKLLWLVGCLLIDYVSQRPLYCKWGDSQKTAPLSSFSSSYFLPQRWWTVKENFKVSFKNKVMGTSKQKISTKSMNRRFWKCYILFCMLFTITLTFN